MFRTSFSKYLIAFTLIIVISFLLMTSIVGTMLLNHVEREKEQSLSNFSSIVSYNVSEHLKNAEESAVDSFDEIKYLLRAQKDLVIIITRLTDGHETVECFYDSTDERAQFTDTITTISFSEYKEKTVDGVDCLLMSEGIIGGITAESSRYCATSITLDGEHWGYAIAAISNAKDDSIMTTVKGAMLNGTLWVLLAAIIAVYFITERIVHPLREMTRVVKTYSEGDFTQRVVVNGRDEAAELGRAFNNMASSLDNLEKMRNSFLASVSHDLRTPMTTISGFIDGINSGAIPPEKHEYYLGVISQEVHRLSRLVTQLLDISRLESGDRKFNMTDFDIAELSRIILISFESKIDEKRLEVEFLSEEDSVMVKADKDAIHQVLYNLCHNAMKFSRENGVFRISIERAEDKKIRIKVYNEGQGIPESDIEMIFDRFYKSDKSRGLDKSGVGLGLYITKTIIDAHGEKISVRSTEGEFCEFTFTLPAGEIQQKRRHTLVDGEEI